MYILPFVIPAKIFFLKSRGLTQPKPCTPPSVDFPVSQDTALMKQGRRQPRGKGCLSCPFCTSPGERRALPAVSLPYFSDYKCLWSLGQSSVMKKIVTPTAKEEKLSFWVLIGGVGPLAVV